MFATGEYQLLDFGAGRKLERFGTYVLDRPSPAAESAKQRRPELWPTADACYERAEGTTGEWRFSRPLDAHWNVRSGSTTLTLKFSESGQVGLFPEQARNWDWIGEQVRAAGRPLEILNLFAYTGGSTLAAAAAGAQVTHVDAAANVVAWARTNAEASELAEAPIRWIVEDALKFAARELKRGHPYDAVILDPPSYGHGPKGETWKLENDLGELLTLCLDLTAKNRQFLLLTCHSGELATATGLLKATMQLAPQLRAVGRLEASDTAIASAAGGYLNFGAAVRYTAIERREPSQSAANRDRSSRRDDY